MRLVAFTVQQKVQVINWYIQTGSATQIQLQFRNEYHVVQPTDNIILSWNQILSETSSLNHRGGIGRLYRSNSDVKIVHSYFPRNGRKSIHQASHDFSIQQSSVQRIARCMRNMFPYRIQMVQAMKNTHCARKL